MIHPFHVRRFYELMHSRAIYAKEVTQEYIHFYHGVCPVCFGEARCGACGATVKRCRCEYFTQTPCWFCCGLMLRFLWSDLEGENKKYPYDQNPVFEHEGGPAIIYFMVIDGPDPTEESEEVVEEDEE